MKAFKGILILTTILVVLILLIFSKPMQIFTWNIREFLDPQLENKIETQWQTASNKYLLNEVRQDKYFTSAIAARVLINRKDKSMVFDYIAILKSNVSRYRATAIKALGKIGDERAIQPLLNIVNDSQNRQNYLVALQALSELKYKPIIPEILRLYTRGNEKDERFKNYAIEMLSNFSTPEAITFLKKKEEEGESDTIRSQAKEALEKIGAQKNKGLF